ncbi:MAG: hypothetical protein K8T25_18195 [Planctomycetia bacterium]|nr:hypothetical protein [Planctomycetia bacterium]
MDVKTLLGHRDSAKASMSINAICFTPDEKRMLSAADDGTVRVWDTSSGAELGVLGNHEGSVNDLALLSDGKTLVSLDQSDRIRLWNVDSPLTVGIGQSSRADWKRNAMASQGMRIAATRGSDIVVCRIANRRLQAEHALRHAGSNPNSRVASVCLSPDGQTLAAGGDFGELEFWNVQYGTKISSLTAHPGESVGHLAFLGRGEVLATVGGAGVVGNAYLWDVRTVARLAAIPGHRGPIQGIAPSADGRRFATLGGEDKSIIVWDYDQARE